MKRVRSGTPGSRMRRFRAGDPVWVCIQAQGGARVSSPTAHVWIEGVIAAISPDPKRYHVMVNDGPNIMIHDEQLKHRHTFGN